MATLHYTSGGSATEIATAGFNLADVQYASQVDALPDGMKGLVYLNEHEGVTSSFIEKMTPFLGNPNVFGFYLVDEPDPTGRWGTYATAENLKAESDWIHEHFPGAKTFVTMMNMGSPTNPDFTNTYNPANTHIDYFGIDPYPVRTGTDTVDYDMIDRAVAAAVKSGIPISNIVPVFQAFGGGNWETSDGGRQVMPTTEQMQTMMDHWAKLVPSPAFDYTYKWGTQNGDTALESSSELQAVFREHNTTTAAASDTTSSDSSAAAPASDAATSDSSSTVTAPSHAATGDSSSTATAPSHAATGDSTSDGSSTATAPSHLIASDGSSTATAAASATTSDGSSTATAPSHAATGDSTSDGSSTATAAGATTSHGSSTATAPSTGDSTSDGSSTATAPSHPIASDGSSTVTAASPSDRGGFHALTDLFGSNDTSHDTAGDKGGSSVDRVLAALSPALSSGSELAATSSPSEKTATSLTGHGFAQLLQGNENAGAGVHKSAVADLTSGHGNDAFDFSKLQDKVQLDHSALADLKSGGLSLHTSPAVTATDDGSHHIIFDSSTGSLSLDSDAVGGAAQAQLATHLPLQHHSLI
ncbi:calcium-binding protein [Mesorhizobium sp. M1365]|uniref:calcium-binding protein n=3 Tax=unclassified Mesorhizobium TaxID=325217 RepID=UPI00333BCB9B